MRDGPLSVREQRNDTARKLLFPVEKSERFVYLHLSEEVAESAATWARQRTDKGRYRKRNRDFRARTPTSPDSCTREHAKRT
jgi:hypothetical protein